MRIINNLDEFLTFCVVRNNGISFFYQGTCKKLPGSFYNYCWLCFTILNRCITRY